MLDEVTLRSAWIKALVSGKYKQTTEMLRHTDRRERNSYCCLGVLLDVIDHEAWRDDDKRGGSLGIGVWKHTNFSWDISEVPMQLFEKTIEAQNLATMNDAGHDFKSLAAYIIKNAVKLNLTDFNKHEKE